MGAASCSTTSTSITAARQEGDAMPAEMSVTRLRPPATRLPHIGSGPWRSQERRRPVRRAVVLVVDVLMQWRAIPTRYDKTSLPADGESANRRGARRAPPDRQADDRRADDRGADDRGGSGGCEHRDRPCRYGTRPGQVRTAPARCASPAPARAKTSRWRESSTPGTATRRGCWSSPGTCGRSAVTARTSCPCRACRGETWRRSSDSPRPPERVDRSRSAPLPDRRVPETDPRCRVWSGRPGEVFGRQP